MCGMRSTSVEYKFYEARVSLPQLLTMNDRWLKEIGIEFPFQRKRILLGLLKFHAQSWTKTSLHIPNRKHSIRDCFYVYTNCLRQLVILKSALNFVRNHELFENVQMTDAAGEYLPQIGVLLLSIQTRANHLIKTLREVGSTVLTLSKPFI